LYAAPAKINDIAARGARRLRHRSALAGGEAGHSGQSGQHKRIRHRRACV
jgi:hypothetical protein